MVTVSVFHLTYDVYKYDLWICSNCLFVQNFKGTLSLDYTTEDTCSDTRTFINFCTSSPVYNNAVFLRFLYHYEALKFIAVANCKISPAVGEGVHQSQVASRIARVNYFTKIYFSTAVSSTACLYSTSSKYIFISRTRVRPTSTNSSVLYPNTADCLLSAFSGAE